MNEKSKQLYKSNIGMKPVNDPEVNRKRESITMSSIDVVMS